MKKIELFSENGESRGYFDIDNQINDLTGKEWVFSTKSVIPKGYPPSFQQNLRNTHGGQKPPELCESLIRTFTKEGDSVLDPFCGVGGTLIGCELAKRQALGIEINQKWIDVYLKVCALENMQPQKVIHGDSREILKNINVNEQYDFILTDVPFWNMDVVEKSKGTYKKVGKVAQGIYSDKSKLSKFQDDTDFTEFNKEDWESLIFSVFTECYRLLKPGKFCSVFIGNMYYNGRYHLLNSNIARLLESVGFILKGEIIWYDINKKLHLYGINYSWIPSIVHQFIMIFRKERELKYTKDELQHIQSTNLDKFTIQ
jgi:DNA modification methylase